jgi:hypothetical protein
MAIAIGGESAFKITLRLQHIADFIFSYSRLAPPQCIAGVLPCQRPDDREALATGGERALEIAPRQEHIVNPVETD